MKPLVSVIIPVYNAEKYVGAAIESVLAQTYPNLEVVVVDDGSTDATPDVLAGYGPRIRRLTRENGGPAAARNLGLREARGEIIAFLDSDDLFLPEKIERQVERLSGAGAPADFVTCNGYCIAEDGAETGRFLQKEYADGQALADDLILKRGICTSFSTILARKAALEAIGPIDQTLLIGEDRKFWLAAARKCRIGFSSEFLIKYRRRRESISSVRNNDAVFENNRRFLNQVFSERPYRRRLILKAKAYSYHYFYAAWAYNLLKEGGKAGRFILASFLLYPFRLTCESRLGLASRIFLGDRLFNLLNRRR